MLCKLNLLPLGREVKRLVNNEFKVEGKYTYDFNASGMASGVYFYRFESIGYSLTRRMVFLK